MNDEIAITLKDLIHTLTIIEDRNKHYRKMLPKPEAIDYGLEATDVQNKTEIWCEPQSARGPKQFEIIFLEQVSVKAAEITE